MTITGTQSKPGLGRALGNSTPYTAITELLTSGNVGPGDDVLMRAPGVVLAHLGAPYPISSFSDVHEATVKARTVWLALVRHGILNMLNVPDNVVDILDHPRPMEADTSAFPQYDGEPLDFHEIRFMLDEGMLNPGDSVVIETNFRTMNASSGLSLLADRVDGSIIGNNRIETRAEWIDNRLILTDGMRELSKSWQTCRPRTTPGGGCTDRRREMIEPIKVVEYPTSSIGRPGDGRPETPDRVDDGGANDRDQDQGGGSSDGTPDEPTPNLWEGASIAGIKAGTWSLLLGGGALASVIYQRYNDGSEE